MSLSHRGRKPKQYSAVIHSLVGRPNEDCVHRLEVRPQRRQGRETRSVRFALGALIAVLLIVTATACHGTAHGDVGHTADSQTVATSASECGTCSRSALAATSTATQSEVAQPSPPAAAAQQPPLRAVVFIDQTGSMELARVPHVTADSLTPLLDRLQVAGGELAVGLIRDRSDAPLVRVFVPAPPLAPVFPPRKTANIFEKARERKREDEERARYAARQQTWHADAAARINAFVESIAPLFANADAPATDIHAALLRADVFVSEPNAFGQPVTNVVILVTDGVETVDPETPAQFKSPAELLLVNGTGSEGQLAALHPTRFEALDAAIRYVIEGGSRVRR
jgi:hypothetical protein